MKAEKMTDRGAKELSAAIIMDAITDYDKLIYQYFKYAYNPLTQDLIKFKDFDYIGSLGKYYSNKWYAIEASQVETFFDSEWFKFISSCVGDYHADQIRNARRKLMGEKAIEDGIISQHILSEIFELNGWEVSK